MSLNTILTIRTQEIGGQKWRKTDVEVGLTSFIFRLYRNLKRKRALGHDRFCVFVIGLFETLICAIAEDKVCDSCTVSS